MATELHYRDGGAWRKAKELHYRDGGTWRKLKEAWYRDGGSWRKIFSGSSPVSLFGGNLLAAGFPTASAVSCSLDINTDGTFSASFTGSNVTFFDGTTGDKWFDPITGGIGGSYWVRATLSSGAAPSSGSGTGTWLALSSVRTWTYNSGTGGALSNRAGTLLLEIASDSGGANIVASGSYSVEASRES